MDGKSKLVRLRDVAVEYFGYTNHSDSGIEFVRGLVDRGLLHPLSHLGCKAVYFERSEVEALTSHRKDGSGDNISTNTGGKP
jgi:hypothetical protein